MAAKMTDVYALATIAERYVPREVLSKMLAEMSEAVKDTANQSVVETFRRLRLVVDERTDEPTPADQQARREHWLDILKGLEDE